MIDLGLTVRLTSMLFPESGRSAGRVNLNRGHRVRLCQTASAGYFWVMSRPDALHVVEAYRLGRYDNKNGRSIKENIPLMLLPFETIIVLQNSDYIKG